MKARTSCVNATISSCSTRWLSELPSELTLSITQTSDGSHQIGGFIRFNARQLGFLFFLSFFYLARETDRDAEDAVAPLLRSIALVGPGVGTCRILAKNGVSANPNGFLRLIARAPPLNPPPNAPHHFFNPNSIIFNSFGTPHSSILTRINVRVDHRPAPSPSGGASPLHSTIHLILGLEFFYLFSFFLYLYLYLYLYLLLLLRFIFFESQVGD